MKLQKYKGKQIGTKVWKSMQKYEGKQIGAKKELKREL